MSNVTYCESISQKLTLQVCIIFWTGLTCISIVLIIAMYLKIYAIAHGYGTGNPALSRNPLARTKNQKALVTTALLLASVVVFWGPLIVTRSMSIFSGLDSYSATTPISMLLTLLNPVVDPVIIVMMRMNDVKKQYDRLCCCCCCRKMIGSRHANGETRTSLPNIRSTYM